VSEADAIVVGSGPNGLAAAVRLAQAGAAVTVLEAEAELGGGTRSGELTLPGFLHDRCSAVHPMGVLSPYLRTLPLADHGLRWLRPAASIAHPLDDGPAVILRRSVEDTAAALDGDRPGGGAPGPDARAYRRLLAPFVDDPHALLADALGPLRVPRHPIRMLRFGLRGVRSAIGLAGRFRGARARALLAGCAAHSILPLDRAFTGAVGLMFLITGHADDWPVAEGGSGAIARALASLLRASGGRIETGVRVRALADLPPARVYLFDTSPAQLAAIAGPVLPARYVRRLGRYRYGPGVFKLDWALDGPIPWRDPRCLEASTVHVGGTLEEIAASEAAVWRGEHPERPFLIVCQQSQLDPTRAPPGKHTGYAYCHVPAGSTADRTEAIERQIERFAPGFRDRILARRATTPAMIEAENASCVGGAITGGVADARQLFARPVLRLDPYTTPNRRVFLCSASTPPGGGVHGMCGFHAAGSALRRLPRLRPAPLA
jgi:phytoene dehydrogenase-like protein